jgi:hypothetical protein
MPSLRQQRVQDRIAAVLLQQVRASILGRSDRIAPIERGVHVGGPIKFPECDSLQLVAEDLGGDEAETLLNLWTTLTAQHDAADAVTFVADAYSKRAGRYPARRDRREPM